MDREPDGRKAVTADLDVIRRDIDRLQQSRESQGERIGKLEQRFAVVENRVASLVEDSAAHGEGIHLLQLGAKGAEALFEQGKRTEEAVRDLARTVEGRFAKQDAEIEGIKRWRWYVIGWAAGLGLAAGVAWTIYTHLAGAP